MQVSTVCTNIYTIFGNTDTQTPDSANSSVKNNVFKPYLSPKANDSDGQDFTYINEWKKFCCQQIANGNIDFIA